jgi:hypothetical protein
MTALQAAGEWSTPQHVAHVAFPGDHRLVVTLAERSRHRDAERLHEVLSLPRPVSIRLHHWSLLK